MKQKISVSWLVLCLLLLVFPVSVQGEWFAAPPDSKPRIERRQAQIHNRLCVSIADHALTPPDWCEQEPPVEPPAPPEPPLPPAPPAPDFDGLLITEVYYDVDAAHGTENANEWIEIYNGTASPIDLSGWMIIDNLADDNIPDGTILAANSFAIITNNISTADFWALPEGTLLIALGGPIGNTLGNTSDVVILKTSEGEEIDAVSWGENNSAFDPPVAGVAEGHSIMRLDINTDTNTAADWTDAAVPGPGAAG